MGIAIYRKNSGTSTPQAWTGLPDSPVATSAYPYQCIVKNNTADETKLYVSPSPLSAVNIYEDFSNGYIRRIYLIGEERNEYQLVAGAWVSTNQYPPGTSNLAIIADNTNDHTIWKNYPPSPVNSSLAYSNACVVTDGTDVFLFVSNNALYYNESTHVLYTLYVNKTTYKLSGGEWEYYDSNGSLQIIDNGIIESNTHIFNTETPQYPIVDSEIAFYPTCERLRFMDQANNNIAQAGGI